eukprot:scaffold30225_cov146-Isochrysis_galbana.AAC.1
MAELNFSALEKGLSLSDFSRATLDELGEIIQGAIYRGNISDLELDTFPPTRWGNGYKGTAATQFPHPEIYSLHDSRIPLDQLTVRHLTRILSARKRKHPPAKAAWQARLNIKDHV